MQTRRTNVRWVIAVFMFFAIAINYLDRTNLSVAAPVIAKTFHIDPATMGMIMSAFFWTYALFQIPAGWLADKVGQRVTLALAVGWWSLMTMATVLARGVGSLLGLRLLLGVGEAGAYPSNAGIAAKWFPDHERTRVAALFDAGSKIGTAVAMPFVVWLLTRFGWQMPFIISGLIGFVWVALWWWYYRDPEKHLYVNEAELAYIRSGQAKQEGLHSRSPMKWYELFKYRNTWAMCVGFFMLNYAIYFFITWFPTYLVNERGMKLMTMGFVAMIPPLVGLVAELFAGWFTDWLMTKGLSRTAARKVCLVGGMLVATSIAAAGLVHSAAMCVVLLAISYAGLEFAACNIWALPGDVAPPGMSSVLGGIQNCVSNIGGILGPIITGYVVATTHSFVPALLISGAATLIGAATYLFWLGKVEPLDLKSSSQTPPFVSA